MEIKNVKETLMSNYKYCTSLSTIRMTYRNVFQVIGYMYRTGLINKDEMEILMDANCERANEQCQKFDLCVAKVFS